MSAVNVSGSSLEPRVGLHPGRKRPVCRCQLLRVESRYGALGRTIYLRTTRVIQIDLVPWLLDDRSTRAGAAQTVA